MAGLKGMSFIKRNCFWCRMRALGKSHDDAIDDDVEASDFVLLGSGPGDPRPGGLVGFRAAQLDAREDVGTLRVAISRTAGALGAVEVEVATQDGTANEVVDYMPPINGRIRWEDGETEDKFVEVGVRIAPCAATLLSRKLVLLTCLFDALGKITTNNSIRRSQLSKTTSRRRTKHFTSSLTTSMSET